MPGELKVVKGDKEYKVVELEAGFWVTNEEGEGMMITRAQLFVIFNKYWKENF